MVLGLAVLLLELAVGLEDLRQSHWHGNSLILEPKEILSSSRVPAMVSKKQRKESWMSVLVRKVKLSRQDPSKTF